LVVFNGSLTIDFLFDAFLTKVLVIFDFGANIIDYQGFARFEVDYLQSFWARQPLIATIYSF
jgi:hypothetical protein